jgi:hypothetical protein
MYLLISGSSRPCGFFVSRSGVGLSVARAAWVRGGGGQEQWVGGSESRGQQPACLPVL